MPDHFHFVCRLTIAGETQNAGARGELKAGVLEHVARFKSFTTRESHKLGFHGKLWQRSSYDKLIDLDRPLEQVVRYTLENPQRAGMVAVWREWPWAAIVDPL